MTPITKDGEYTTRSGLPVRIYATKEETKSCTHGAIYRNDRWIPCTWSSDGEYCMGEQHELDLIPKPKVRKLGRWVHLYHSHNDNLLMSFCLTREDADCVADKSRIACKWFEFSFTEGEGLE